MERSRREFLKYFGALAGCWATSASSIPLLGANHLAAAAIGPAAGRFHFPQGVASADPQPDAVMFWTRVVATGAGAQSPPSIKLNLQVALGREFETLVVNTPLRATPLTDHTVRCFVDSLASGCFYYYRFVAEDGTVSRVGRTRTAPAPTANHGLRIAVFSCQHYEQGFFGAYRRCLNDDQDAPQDAKLDLILHVGDFIYESIHRSPTPTMNGPSALVRTAADFPSESKRSAISLADFRHLYKTYLSDPDLLTMRANYPFLYVWDDHELANDYYQSFQGNQAMQGRKLASNRAWFEYMPAVLSQAPKGPAGFNPARDLSQVTVADAAPAKFDDHFLSHEPNNLAAIGSLTIQRSLKWGQLVDLLLVDGRSYRGPRGLDASLIGSAEFAAPNLPMPPELIATLNAGRTANAGNPPDSVEIYGSQINNPRKHAPYGSMLGKDQKQWLKDSLTNSTATWKIICNNTPMLRFGFDMSFEPKGPKSGILWSDSWDGYPLERSELMQFIRNRGVANVVSLSGDRHAHFAGLVYDDYESDQPHAVIAELVGAAVSAPCRAAIQARHARENAVLAPLIGFDASTTGYRYSTGPGINGWMLYGHQTARQMHRSLDEAHARRVADDAVNPHLWYADNDAFGYYLVDFSASQMRSQFVTVAEPVHDHGSAGPPAIRRVSSVVKIWGSGEEPAFEDLQIEGDRPVLGVKEPNNLRR